ncbi:MAG: thioesterase domain-containing protein, partial [Opitutaceae bacterium]
DYMVPSSWTRLEQLPLTSTGKVDRPRLPKPAAHREMPASAAAIPPRDLLEFKLAQLWENCLGAEPAGVRQDFFEAGGYSLRAIALMAAVKRSFGRTVPLLRFLENPTIEHLGTVLRATPEPLTSRSCVIPIQAAGTKPPIFCAPPGGGNPIHYRHLSRCLGNDQPFYGLQSPGLEGECEPFDDWTRLAAHYIETVKRIQPCGPFFLGGWSDGGRVALEMAQQLYRQGEEVALLAIFDEQLEQVDPALVSSDAEILFSMVASILPVDLEALRALGPTDRLLHVLDLAKRANLLPPDYALVHAQRQFQVFKANALARVKYRPSRYPGRVALFWANEKIHDDIATRSALWRRVVAGDMEAHLAPGNHLTLMSRDHAPVLAQYLNACLERAYLAAPTL